jgi:prepilin-type N-terminal cleavage/methylation domain-containing protein
MARAYWQSERGFTMVDMVAALALIGILSAVAIPTMTSTVDATRLAQATREVERELQIAKSRAVGKGRPIRIRFNCPSAGMYRITELIGTVAAPAAADSAANRCDESVYPFPAGDADPMTLPNNDGPMRRLSGEASFGAVQTIEFWPDGTAHYSNGVTPWGMIPVNSLNLTLTRNGKTATITVNGLGRIQTQ